MPRSRAIALVANRRQVDAVLDTVRTRRADDVRVIALTLDARLGMRRAAAAYDTPPGLSQSLDRSTLRRDARYFARYWFELTSLKSDELIREFGAYHGYPLYAMQWTHLCYWLTEALISLEVARLIFEREEPTELILVDDAPAPPGYWYSPDDNWDAAALALMASHHGVPVTWLRSESAPQRVHKRHPIRRCIGAVRDSLAAFGRGSADGDGRLPPLPRTTNAIDREQSCVLAVTHGHHYLSQLLPHVLALSERGHRVVLAHHERLDSHARERLVAAGIELTDLSRLVAADREAAVEWKRRGEATFDAVDRNRALREFFTHRNGIPFWRLIRPKFRTLLLGDIPLTVAHLAAAEEIIASVRPNLLLAGLCEASTDAAYALAAKAADVPSLGLQHGTILKGHAECVAFASDEFAVWGSAAQHSLTRSSDAIVGNADFEERYGVTRTRETTCGIAGIKTDPTRPVCLYLGAVGWAVNDVDRYAEEDLFATVLDLKRAMPDLQLIMRLHAGEVTELLREMARERGVDAIIDPKASLRALLKLSDVVVSQTTTAGLEAMIAGKPVVYLNIHCERDWLPYAQCGAALGVYEAEQLAPAVKRVLTDPELREELAAGAQALIGRQVNGLAGDSSSRMVSLCERLMTDRERNHWGCSGPRPRAVAGESTDWSEYLARMTAFMRPTDADWRPPVAGPQHTPDRTTTVRECLRPSTPRRAKPVEPLC